MGLSSRSPFPSKLPPTFFDLFFAVDFFSPFFFFSSHPPALGPCGRLANRILTPLSFAWPRFMAISCAEGRGLPLFGEKYAFSLMSIQSPFDVLFLIGISPSIA